MLRDTRCLERSGLGQSPHHEQSRWRASRSVYLDPWPCVPPAVAAMVRQLPISAVVPTTDSVVRDVRVVCCRARGNSHLQKPQKRTRPAKSSRTAMPGTRSSRGFRTSMNTCRDCSRWPTRAIPPLNATFERGPGQWSPEVEGTSSQRTSVALTCPDRSCLGGWDLERFRSHRTPGVPKVSEGLVRQGCPG